jgi:hypothetical protein
VAKDKRRSNTSRCKGDKAIEVPSGGVALSFQGGGESTALLTRAEMSHSGSCDGRSTASKGGSIQAYAARLGDERLQTVQRCALATQIGQRHGNRHLQGVIAPFASGKKTKPLAQVPTQETLREYADTPAGVQRKRNPSAKRKPQAKRFKPNIHWGGIDYRRLLKDSKLEIGVAFGDDFPLHYPTFVNYLEKRGFKIVGERSFKSRGVERWQRVKRFQIKMKRAGKRKSHMKSITVEITADLINQSTRNPKQHFSEFLSGKEIVIYAGHGRDGAGPDFDPKNSDRENFVIGQNSALHRTGRLTKGHSSKMNRILQNRANDLEAMSKAGKFNPKLYQIWFFNACRSFRYLDEIRGGLVKGKSRSNLRVVGTTKAVHGAAYNAMRFFDGILKQRSMKQILKRLNQRETAKRKELIKKGIKRKLYKSYYFSD